MLTRPPLFRLSRLRRPMHAVPPGHFTVLSFLRSHPHLECVPIDLQVAQEAAHLRADRRLSPPDALIVGTGIAAQAGHLVTNDRAWTARLVSMAPRLAVVQVSSHLPFGICRAGPGGSAVGDLATRPRA